MTESSLHLEIAEGMSEVAAAIKAPMDLDETLELITRSAAVADQRRDPDSLLSWIKLLIQRYRECPELSWGNCTVLEHESPSVFAHASEYEGGKVVALHNFSDQPTEVTLAVAGAGVGVRVADLLTGHVSEVGNDGTLRHAVDAYGCCWLRVLRQGDRYIV